MESKKSTTYSYKVEDSAQRMDDILNADNDEYQDNENNIPTRDKLTYKIGYYVNVTALFIDMIDSSKLTDGHQRPTLAKMYRSFLSECVAIMNSWSMCKEININGDCVWGVFETPKKSDVDNVISVAAQLNSMVNILNSKLQKKKYDTISVGIGIDDGRTLMVKAGYSGSGINDVIWMGNTINNACHLANKAGRNGRKTIIITQQIYDNINEHHQGLFDSFYDTEDLVTKYEGNVIRSEMEKWLEENCT